MSKVTFICFVVSLLLDCCFCWLINDINPKMLAKTVFNDDVGGDGVDGNNDIVMQRINLIFPGTKWCGAGNVADNYDDLGVEKETDMCCRDHDNCPDLIPGGGTKYNLTNEVFYTRLSCKCDNKFLECLRSANTKVAKYIGVIYFDALQTKCFREDYPVTKCSKRGGWFKKKCVNYAYDTNGEKMYQWFDVQDF